MLKKLIPVILVLAGIVIFFYYQLGGGEKLEFNLVQNHGLVVQGEEFSGRYNDSRMEDLFFAAKEASKNNPSCKATVVHYLSPVPTDSVKQFIGINISPPSVAEEFTEVRDFDQQKMVVTTITAHNLVMPRPDDVREQAQEFAKSRGIKLDSISIEIYKGDRDLEVMFPVK